MWSRSARVAGGVCVGAARAAERQRENLTTVAVMADKRAGAGRSGRGGALRCLRLRSRCIGRRAVVRKHMGGVESAGPGGHPATQTQA